MTNAEKTSVRTPVILSHLIAVLAVATAVAPRIHADDLVYRHYYQALCQHLDTAEVDAQTVSAVTIRLMSVDWPDSMARDVSDRLEQLFEAAPSQLPPYAIASWATSQNKLPEFARLQAEQLLTQSGKSQQFTLLRALCYAKEISPQGLATIRKIAAGGDIVLAPPALAVLLHQTPKAPDISQHIRKHLADRHEVALRMCDVLALLPPGDIAPFQEPLHNMLKCEDSRVKTAAARALLAHNPESTDALAVVTEGLQNTTATICVGYLVPSNPGTTIDQYARSVLRDLSRIPSSASTGRPG